MPGVSEHPVLRAGHYFLAIEGLAMMRRFLDDPEGLAARAADVERISTGIDEVPQSLQWSVVAHAVDAGYDLWAERYDGPNPAVGAEEPVFDQLLDAAPAGVVIDAACGTGRHAARLHERGYRVVGVDANEAMLRVARAKVPDATFHLGDLSALPVEDGAADVVTCALALTHVQVLAPVLAEFARVLRPGGQVVLSDMHPQMTQLSGQAVFPTDDAGAIHFLPNLVHGVSDYVAAFRAAELEVRDCREPHVTEEMLPAFLAYRVLPDATRQAFCGLPYLLLWRLEKPAPPSEGATESV
jgi:ubiquinone/menaquinone biosynthesis C-methylase UbiE